jgi:adenylosuccinate lyase
MTSLPSPNNDYAAPANMPLTKAAWDAAMVSIGERLRAVEALEADLQSVIDAGVASGQAAIADALAPILAQYADEAQALRDQIALAEDQLAAISAGGVVAANISVSPIVGLSATNGQAAFSEIVALVNGTSDGLSARPTKGTVIALALALG